MAFKKKNQTILLKENFVREDLALLWFDCTLVKTGQVWQLENFQRIDPVYGIFFYKYKTTELFGIDSFTTIHFCKKLQFDQFVLQIQRKLKDVYLRFLQDFLVVSLNFKNISFLLNAYLEQTLESRSNMHKIFLK